MAPGVDPITEADRQQRLRNRVIITRAHHRRWLFKPEDRARPERYFAWLPLWVAAFTRMHPDYPVPPEILRILEEHR